MRGEVRAGRREGVGLRRRKRRARGGPRRGRGIGKLGGGSLEAVAVPSCPESPGAPSGALPRGGL